MVRWFYRIELKKCFHAGCDDDGAGARHAARGRTSATSGYVQQTGLDCANSRSEKAVLGVGLGSSF